MLSISKLAVVISKIELAPFSVLLSCYSISLKKEIVFLSQHTVNQIIIFKPEVVLKTIIILMSGFLLLSFSDQVKSKEGVYLVDTQIKLPLKKIEEVSY